MQKYITRDQKYSKQIYVYKYFTRDQKYSMQKYIYKYFTRDQKYSMNILPKYFCMITLKDFDHKFFHRNHSNNNIKETVCD